MSLNSVTAPTHENDPIQRLTAPDQRGYLPCNTYAITGNGKTVLVDPGPVTLFGRISAELRQTVDLASVVAAVATHATSDAVASVDLWRAAGVGASLYAHWWTAITLQTAGYATPVVPVHPRNVAESAMPAGIELLVPPRLGDAGMLMVFHRPSGTLFSGDLFSSTAGAPESRVRRIQSFHRRFLDNSRDAAELLDFLRDLPVRRICPHHGDPFAASPEILTQILLADGAGEEPAPLIDELEALRREYEDLQYSTVLANDARITDGTTGFYNETFLTEVLPTIVTEDAPTPMIVVRLDDDSVMTDTSSDMLDQVLHAVAVEIVNTGIPDSLNFRLRDNACVTVIPQGSVDAARDGAIAVRQAIRESPLFPLPVTVSIGYGDSHALRALSDGKGALADAVMAGLMTILVRLRTQGPRAWVALSGGDPTAERLRTISVLIVTADRLLSESLAALLHARGIPSRTVTNGRDALTFDRSVPAVVVADKATPQLDAYQIRQEYLSMNVINSVPFVLVTDYKSPETVERSLALGIEHIFVRPVDLEHLAGLCTLLLGRRG